MSLSSNHHQHRDRARLETSEESNSQLRGLFDLMVDWPPEDSRRSPQDAPVTDRRESHASDETGAEPTDATDSTPSESPDLPTEPPAATDADATENPDEAISSPPPVKRTNLQQRLDQLADRHVNAQQRRSQPGRLQRLLQQFQDLHPTASPPRRERPPHQTPPPLPALPPHSPTPAAPSSPDTDELRQKLDELAEKLGHLEHQVYEPTELINPLLPLIKELLSDRTEQSKAEVIRELVPVIDRVILERGTQDRRAMSRALAAVIPGAISQHIQESPDDIANALGPTMGRAIQAQIELERDAMVDALYPVIGNTISKYMAEAISTINQKVENTLSVEGVSRKVRAKMQGVSEAELILREAMPSSVKAIFLIHKVSGLVIAEVQQVGEHRLEPDMVAGMLTAIRSFANDCIVQAGNVTELSEIEYDNFGILLEVAGYCYLAVVHEGDLAKPFITKMRQTLSSIVQYYGRAIESFDGDPETIPAAVPELVEALMASASEIEKQQQRQGRPPALLVILLLAILGIGGWIGRTWVVRRLEWQVLSALESTPELAVYRLDADVSWKMLTLEGKLPDESLRSQAGEIARQITPDRVAVDNQILAVYVPPDPTRVRAELDRLSGVLNQQDNVAVQATYDDHRVWVEGIVDTIQQVDRISQTFEQIPGVRSVVATLTLGELPTASRIYFEEGSAKLDTQAIDARLSSLVDFLDRYPQVQLTVIGHSDPRGSDALNQKLSRQRAERVSEALIERGIEPDRLNVQWQPQPPPDVEPADPLWLSRCVRFEPLFQGEAAR